jgi:hypothetical protein
MPVRDTAVSAIPHRRLGEQVVLPRVDLRPIGRDRRPIAPRRRHIELVEGVGDVRRRLLDLRRGGVLKNTSDIQPDTIHADTQGQSLPVFGLAALLGFDLLPRIATGTTWCSTGPTSGPATSTSTGCSARRPSTRS